MNRRHFLHQGGAFALGVTAGLIAPSAAAAPTNPARKRVLRVAHLTDVHVNSENGSADGMAAAIRHAQAQRDRPELFFFGGDCIFDSLATAKLRAIEQWEIWQRVLAAELKTPARQCIGNHDVLGWNNRKDPAVKHDAAYGKALAMEKLGLAARHYSFDQAGWHFVVLDSMEFTHAVNQGYLARLDDEQFEWLAGDLAAAPAATPVCVLSHIPILSAAAFLFAENSTTGTWQVPGFLMHVDAKRIKNLFAEHPNVKVCVSGHLHMVDDVTYNGVRYLCNGAVSGNWWKPGKWQDFDPAYALIDFYDDGSVENAIEFYPRA